MPTPAPYWPITQGIKSRLDLSLAGAITPVPAVVMEEEYAANESWVGIYLTNRNAPANVQSMSAGTRTRFLLHFELWCWRFAMDGPKAMQLRDELVGATELALMIDRTFGGTCDSSWLEGGDMKTASDPQTMGRFFAGGQIVLTVDTFARTT